MINAIIVDDEITARSTLKELLNDFCENITIAGEAGNIENAVKLVNKLEPDLVFLDIHLPDGLGFDLFSKIDYKDFKIIIITAFEEYAIRAFKFSAIDYLLKPIDPEDLVVAIKKAKKTLENESLGMKLNTFFEHYKNESGNSKSRKIVLKTSERVHLVNINDIVRCKSDKNYTHFHFIDHEPITVSKTLKEYEEILESYNFFRIHQSHLININYVDRYEKTDGGTIHMHDKSVIPVSHRKKDELMKLFKELEYKK